LIAIVDDDALLRSALEMLFGSLGYRSIAYESATSFLASGDAGACHCVISDVSMPGMSGFELTRELRTIGHVVPVILITALSGAALSAQATACGARCLLTKPLEPGQLIECVKEALAA
jgi:FixJ family two-component response regulator